MADCPVLCEGAARSVARRQQPGLALDLIELLFFSYRDFVGDADRRLAADGFGRAHHRVLHFVSRRPGLTVAELLDLLRITKQSLNRVLKELLEKGCVEQREGPVDRRQRLLYVTASGAALVAELAELQSARINGALDQCAPDARAHVVDFLAAMVGDPAPIPSPSSSSSFPSSRQPQFRGEMQTEAATQSSGNAKPPQGEARDANGGQTSGRQISGRQISGREILG